MYVFSTIHIIFTINICESRDNVCVVNYLYTRVFNHPLFWLHIFLAFLRFSCSTLGHHLQTQKGPQKWSHFIHTISHSAKFFISNVKLHSIDVVIIHTLVWNFLIDGQHIGRNNNLKEKKTCLHLLQLLVVMSLSNMRSFCNLVLSLLDKNNNVKMHVAHPSKRWWRIARSKWILGLKLCHLLYDHEILCFLAKN